MNLEQRINNIINEIRDKFDYNKELPLDVFAESFSCIEIFCRNNNLDSEKSKFATAVTHYNNDTCESVKYLLIFNSDVWENTPDNTLKGMVAHELCHFELIENIKNYHTRIRNQNEFGDVPIEMINDLFCVNKGFMRELILCRRHTELKSIELFGHDKTELDIQDFYHCYGLDLHDMERICKQNKIELEDIING